MVDPEPLTMGLAVFDRAADRRKDQAWLDEVWPRAQVLLVSSGSTTPVYQDGDLKRLALVDSGQVDQTAPRWFLGVAEDVPYFFIRSDPPAERTDWIGVREIGRRGDPLELDLLVTAVALWQWHARHTHCPLCGAETVIDQGGWTRRCPIDDSEHFPRTDPAVIMLVHDGGDRALLGRGAIWAPGRYSTLAGFVEPGESLESAVIREVFEEVGVAVRDVQYVASQPWPFPASLMLGFTARADGTAQVRPDKVEMAEAGWFTRAQVAQAADWTDTAYSATEGDGILHAIPARLSISRFLIDSWLAGRIPH